MNPCVIFHIDEMAKWKLLLHNVKNLIASYDNQPNSLQIEVLANSEAVKGYLHDESLGIEERIKALHNQGVVFSACNNALTGLNIPRDQLFSVVTIVPAGVRELVDRQMEGYAYIKP